MPLVKAQLLDSEGTSLLEAMVAYSDAADATVAAAAEALHEAAVAVADGTMEDVRSVQRVSGVLVEGRAVVPLDAVIRCERSAMGWKPKGQLLATCKSKRTRC
ncbi:MAG TPA: hypothetical protein VGN80_09655 [Devosiaceae bacterium]|nr:hypothetical protein [Devosiaceae bacterium]